MKIVYIGYTTVARPGAAELCPTFEAPSSYKDPIKIDEYVAKKKAEWLEEAKDRALTGSFQDIVALERAPLSLQSNWIKFDLTRSIFSQLTPYSVICALDLSKFLRLARAQAVDVGSYAPTWSMMSLSSEKRMLNPLYEFVDNNTENDLALFLKRFPQCQPAQDWGNPAANMAEITRNIARLIGY